MEVPLPLAISNDLINFLTFQISIFFQLLFQTFSCSIPFICLLFWSCVYSIVTANKSEKKFIATELLQQMERKKKFLIHKVV